MPAWRQTRSVWDDAAYRGYRTFVTTEAPRLRGNTSMDCADLSALLLIRYAAKQGLPLVFTDMDGIRYDSRLEQQDPVRGWFPKTWKEQTAYENAVTDRIGTEALWSKNTTVNLLGPEPGDLMMKFTGNNAIHHTALVYQVWLQGTAHPRVSDRSVPDFPADQPGREADEIAISQPNTEYFRDRDPNSDVHIDYLNHRSKRKNAGAELIYFARVSPFVTDGYQFRRWLLRVPTAMVVPEAPQLSRNVG